jgi:hypothetical protein
MTIDKNRFKQYLPAEEAALGNAEGLSAMTNRVAWQVKLNVRSKL